MKQLIIILLFVVPILQIAVANESLGKTDVIVKIDQLTAKQNIDIINLFEKDNKFHVTNTCSILGLVVFSPTAENQDSRLEAAAYIQQKLKRIIADKAVVVQQDISKGQVNKKCRAKLAALNTDE